MEENYKELNVNEDWQVRLLDEMKELIERISKLETALNSEGFKEKVGDTQYSLMSEQLKHMKGYCSVLSKRMLNLNLI